MTALPAAYFFPNQFYDYHWPWVLADSPLSTLAQRTLAPALPTMPRHQQGPATGVKP